MERADLLADLAARGTDTDPARCAELAAKLGMLVSDLLVVAGHPVPVDLLPHRRDPRVMKEFAYRASFCDHAQMAALVDFIRLPPSAAPGPSLPPAASRKVYWRPEASYLATVLDGLIRNRGFTPRELPFMGLSMSTIFGLLSGRSTEPEHLWFQLSQIAGPLGWKFEDLLAVAGPLPERQRYVMHCHHLGQVFVEAIGLTNGQLIEAAKQADQLSGQQYQGAWRPFSHGFVKECPDLSEVGSPSHDLALDVFPGPALDRAAHTAPSHSKTPGLARDISHRKMQSRWSDLRLPLRSAKGVTSRVL